MVKLLWRLRHLAAAASGGQEARCLPALLRTDTRRNERTWRPVNTHSQRQSVSEMKDALSCPSPHIITLCNTLKYNKNFRGWGRVGGDPFLKGSLPHKAFPDSITPEHDLSRTRPLQNTTSSATVFAASPPFTFAAMGAILPPHRAQTPRPFYRRLRKVAGHCPKEIERP